MEPAAVLLQGLGHVRERLAFLYPSGIQLPGGRTARWSYKANVLNRTTNVRCYRDELIHIGEHLLYEAATGLVRLPVLGFEASPS